jgi:hypothetical protein
LPSLAFQTPTASNATNPTGATQKNRLVIAASSGNPSPIPTPATAGHGNPPRASITPAAATAGRSY